MLSTGAKAAAPRRSCGSTRAWAQRNLREAVQRRNLERRPGVRCSASVDAPRAARPQVSSAQLALGVTTAMSTQRLPSLLLEKSTRKPPRSLSPAVRRRLFPRSGVTTGSRLRLSASPTSWPTGNLPLERRIAFQVTDTPPSSPHGSRAARQRECRSGRGRSARSRRRGRPRRPLHQQGRRHVREDDHLRDAVLRSAATPSAMKRGAPTTSTACCSSLATSVAAPATPGPRARTSRPAGQLALACGLLRHCHPDVSDRQVLVQHRHLRDVEVRAC